MGDDAEVIPLRAAPSTARAEAETTFDIGASLGELGSNIVHGRVGEHPDAVVVVMLRNDGPPQVGQYGKLAPGPGGVQGYPARNGSGATMAEAMSALRDVEHAYTFRGILIGGDPPEASAEVRLMGLPPSERHYESWSDYLAERWEKRRSYRQQATERVATAEAAAPWQCDHCRRRFKTERGTKQHEASCWYNKANTCACSHQRKHHPANHERRCGWCECDAFTPLAVDADA